MSPKEALDRLRDDPGDRDAWEVVKKLVKALAEKETDDAGLREGAADAVRRSLEDKLLDGDLPPIASPAGYLANAVRWRIRDLLRRRARERAAAERARLAPPAPPEEPEPLPAEILGTLERIAERAIKRRDAWQREHLRRSWLQVKALHLDGLTLRAIVARDEGIDPADEAEVQRAVQRAHKAHQRARAAFDQALGELIARGDIDPDTGAAARAAIARLKRRQDRGARSVSGEGGDPP